jgi:hypothetical protein
MCKSFLMWCGPICQFLLLFPWQLESYSKNNYLCLYPPEFSLFFSCSSFNVSHFILRSLIHLELIFMQGERWGCSFSFLHVNNQFSQHHLLKRLSFLWYMFLLLCQRPDGWSCLVLFRGLCSFGLHVYFFCQYHAVFVTMALSYDLKSSIFIFLSTHRHTHIHRYR